MNLFRAFDRGFLRPLPPERLALVRILVGLFGLIYLMVRIPAFVRLGSMPARDFDPVGPLMMLPGPVPTGLLLVALGTGLLSGVGFVRGAKYRWSGPAFALSLVFLTSYRSSFGMIFHTENLLVIHAALLALVPADLVLAPGRPMTAAPDQRTGWPLQVLGLATTLTYLLAGIAKLDGLGLAWTEGQVLMGHVAYDALRKMSVGGGYSTFGAWLLAYPAVFGPLATLSLVVEIAAPLALLHRLVGMIWCGLAWSFHLGVLALMLIGFPYPLTGVGFASFFPVERLLRVGQIGAGLRWLTGCKAPGHE